MLAILFVWISFFGGDIWRIGDTREFNVESSTRRRPKTQIREPELTKAKFPHEINKNTDVRKD